MTFGSVCSGIEAASVAWRPLGWRCAFVAEIDPFARAVLAHHCPEIPNLGDFTSISASAGPVDVLVGGTPCQSFSVAGLRRGMDDDRGNLALEFLRLAGRLRPRWVVWENVPGVLSSGGGRDFGAFLGGLVELGYGFAYRVLDAQHFGVPQRRRRVFVVGYLGDWRRAVAVLLERDCLSRRPAPRREAGPRVAPDAAPGDRRASGQRSGEQLTVAPALTSSPYGDHESREGLLVAHTLRADGFDASEDGTGRGTLGPMGTIRSGNAGLTGGVPFIVNAAESCAKQSHARPSEVARCLDSTGSFANAQGGTVVAYNIVGLGQEGRNHAVEATMSGCLQSKGLSASGNEAGTLVACDLRHMTTGEVAPTLQAGGTGSGPNNNPHVVSAIAVRRLTPLECERLMGFPDHWTLVPYRGKPASDGPRYKAIGNSMAVPVMAWIGQRISVCCGSGS